MDATDEVARLARLEISTIMMIVLGLRVPLTRGQWFFWTSALLLLVAFSAHGKCPYRDHIVCLGMLALGHVALRCHELAHPPEPN